MLQGGAYLAGGGKSDHADPPEQLPPVFRLVGHQAFVGKSSSIVAPHHVGTSEFFEFAKRGIACCQAGESLDGQDRLFRQAEELSEVDAEDPEIEIAADGFSEPYILYLREDTPVGAIGIVARIPGQDRADAGCVAAVPAGDVLLIEYATGHIGYRA